MHHISHAKVCCCYMIFKPREFDVNVPAIKGIYIILVKPQEKQSEAFYFRSLLVVLCPFWVCRISYNPVSNKASLILLSHTSFGTSCFNSDLGNIIYVHMQTHTYIFTCKQTHMYIKLFFPQCFAVYFLFY